MTSTKNLSWEKSNKKLQLKPITVSALNKQQMKNFVGGMANSEETDGCV